MDRLLKGGTLIDGSGSRRGDVLVRDGRIVSTRINSYTRLLSLPPDRKTKPQKTFPAADAAE